MSSTAWTRHHILRASTGSLISDTWTSSRQLTDQTCTFLNSNKFPPMLCVCAVDCFVCPPFSACGLPPATTGVGNLAARRHNGGCATWAPMRGPDQKVNLPATWSKAPFVVVPWVVERFDFRVLRQKSTYHCWHRRPTGRRVVDTVCASLDLFVHETTARASFSIHRSWITSTVCLGTLATAAARSG
jgi:hypothetical protein